jgi:hypothetical protein
MPTVIIVEDCRKSQRCHLSDKQRPSAPEIGQAGAQCVTGTKAEENLPDFICDMTSAAFSSSMLSNCFVCELVGVGSGDRTRRRNLISRCRSCHKLTAAHKRADDRARSALL